jgi:hypothetical protein
MALVATLLHDDVRAANPITVVQAIVRVGVAFLGPCLLAGVVLLAVLGMLTLAFAAPDVVSASLAMWAFWAFTLYAAMVLLRVLGLFTRRHSAALGWFPERPRWGARSHGLP